ncbi:hypothetical protein EGW08_003123 [Elysia chlorotica]|uniref:Insulin-like domain-containing protein n=1 Tax=Elysia chlorotica TaxID=188477 RepID=A0A433U5L4_ELYCH|nr:hypothetical protein EGW08_003123 [Elysia chlorotica]
MLRHLVDRFLALTCLMLAAAILVAADTQRCDGDERPHPRGLCGQRLAQAHSNLCFLLREVYHREHYHREKRSDPRPEPRHQPAHLQPAAKELVEKIYSIPLDVLAELDLSKDNWHVLLAKKSWAGDNYFGADDFPGNMAASGPEKRRRSHHRVGVFGRRIARLLQEAESGTGSQADVSDVRSVSRTKRTVSSNMVCDCCYNRCSPEELATYC